MGGPAEPRLDGAEIVGGRDAGAQARIGRSETYGRSILDAAVSRLERLSPEFSARQGVTAAQSLALAAIALAAAALYARQPTFALLCLQALFSLSFSLLLAVRFVAIWRVLNPPALPTEPTSRPASPAQLRGAASGTGCVADASVPADEALPHYAVLVALYDEADVVPQLVRALSALDYPSDCLDIVFALEARDSTTRAALKAARLPTHMRWIIVPEGLPKTKPRALCYALQFARGDFVVVYDAEDQPEPTQLRHALRAFAAGGARLGCLQARLNVYNRHDSWLCAQFGIEYTVLFDAILPSFAEHGFPVLLGGTSNHFPRSVLEAVGTWDPYNVTEDADLGLRLARFGWRVGILETTTWEEAPPGWSSWLAQRTRWQKGWLQTYFVHMRRPVQLWRDLGTRSWLWVQVVLGGGLFSALVHPWFYVWMVWTLTHGGLIPPEPGSLAAALWWGALGTMLAAYLAAIALAQLTLKARGFAGLYWHALASPLYWLPISFATYRAIWEWITAPHYWAKTPHRARWTPKS